MGVPAIRASFSSSSVILCVLGMLCLSAVGAGCTPRVLVRAHPGPRDHGVRYYRPKPYLKIEPAEVAVDKNQSTIVPGVVRLSLVYMPDFSEEYAIEVKSGFGTADVGIKLEDGWNLTEISQNLDSQTDENLEAIGSLLSAVGDVVPTSQAGSPSDVSFTVPARNVPIGFYESIIGRDARGCKRLYGFRYVGFVPFSSCPVDVGGQQSACCGDPLLGLYGLMFVDGQMVFQPLPALADTQAVRAMSPGTNAPEQLQATAATRPANPEGQAIDREQLSIGLRAHLQQAYRQVAEVRVSRRKAWWQVSVLLEDETLTQPIQQAAEQWLLDQYGDASMFDVQLLRVEGQSAALRESR